MNPTSDRRSFLSFSAALIAGGACFPRDLWSQGAERDRPLLAYVGTFSSPLKNVLPTQVDLPPGNGRGIHCFSVDRETGAMTPIGITEMGTSPSHLAISATGDRLYSANETDRVGERGEGTITTFAIDHRDGGLTEMGTVRSGGAGPTYVSLHPKGKHLFVANYFGGSIAVLPIDADGKLGEATFVYQDEGTIGPTRAANAPPGSFAFSGHDRTHAHMIQAVGDSYVYHVDLGLDRIYAWQFNEGNGTLTPMAKPWVSLPPGDGPRHFSVHPNQLWFYSVQEEGSTIVLYDLADGQLTERQTISTLPPGYSGSNFCSEILVSDDGRFVYVGNRLHDSIGIFAVGETGELSHVDDEWTRGNYPRSFTFDPTGTFLYCCNQRADHVTVFKVDRESGRLKFTGHYQPVGNPSCVTFLDLKA